MNQKINFCKIAYFGVPFAGHFIAYETLFRKLNQKHGVDIYVGTGKENFEGIFNNIISTNSMETTIFDDDLLKFVFGTSYGAVTEIEELWSKANYKPELIVSDMFSIHGFVLGKR